MKKIILATLITAAIAACSVSGPPESAKIAGCENKTISDLKQMMDYKTSGNSIFLKSNTMKGSLIYTLHEDGKMHFQSFITDNSDDTAFGALYPNVITAMMCKKLNEMK